MTIERLNRKYQRHIVRRIIVRGTLILDTPTCLSSGDYDDLIDLMLVRDSLEDKALLTGASIAGALRNYVREYGGYTALDESQLFGCQRDERDGEQSPLIVYDSISSDNLKAELRDGVKIKSTTGTAEKGAKYDLELLEAGTKFNLCFELLIDEQDKNENILISELAIALSGLEQGEISLGMKKRRGFGRCHVKEWQVWNFNLEDTGDRTAWLNFEHWHTELLPNYPTHPSIKEAFEKAGIQVNISAEDKRERFSLQATFKLVGSLLIRSGQDSTGRAPDVVHLKSHQPSKTNAVPVLPGTSLAGVLRHRAERIINTLEKPTSIIDEVFGTDFSKDKSKQAKASRLVVHEKVIEDATELVQNRIAIDRFTGGAYHGALFSEQPIFGSDETRLTLELELRQPKNAEIGLLLLLLKDLWTSDLPVGGESSIGRGRLQGIKATMMRQIPGEAIQTWTISQDGERLQVSEADADALEAFVSDFSGEVAA